MVNQNSIFDLLLRTGVPNLGDARGLISVISWVHLYQWEDAIENAGGDEETKRLGTLELEHASFTDFV